MNLPTPSEDNNDLFTQMAQLFIDTYEELEAETEFIKRIGAEYHINDVKAKKLVDLQERYTAIVEEYQEQIFAQPPELDEKQKRYIELFLKGQCSDGYLMTHLRVHDWNDAQSMIEQYKQEVIQ